MYVSLATFSVSPWLVTLRLTPSIYTYLFGLPLLRFHSGSHSKIFSVRLFPRILFTCTNHRSRFSSITSKMFVPTSMTALMVLFRKFSFLDFLAELLKKLSQLQVICSPIVCSVSMFLPHIHVKWVHCHHGMARPRVADRGYGLQIWRVAANILNKQSRTADSG
jgi:hypothetical protein